MSGNDDPRAASRAVAREAEPLRRALARFFHSRVSDPAEVDDLVQEVFTRIVARESPQPIERLTGYVFHTAASVLADRHRRRSARRAEAHVAFDPDRHSDLELDPQRILSGKQELRAAVAALLSLPERTRTIFILHRLEGRRYRDVADQLGISVSAVEKHMVKAIQHLSATLEDRA